MIRKVQGAFVILGFCLAMLIIPYGIAAKLNYIEFIPVWVVVVSVFGGLGCIVFATALDAFNRGA